MGGIAVRDILMFRRLCGEAALKNVIIVTNMWGEVKAGVGEAREAELMRNEKFYKPVLDWGARMARHDDTSLSAETIIKLLLNNPNPRLPLHIQDELVTQGKTIEETAAAEELDWPLKEHLKNYEREKQDLLEFVQQVAKDRDEETKKVLEIKTKSMEKQLEKFRNDSRRLESDYEKDKEKLNARIRDVEERAREELKRMAAQYRKDIDELKNLFRINTAASDPRGSYNDNWITIHIYE